MTNKTLDAKLSAIRANTYKPTDFVIADAKDGDIGFGAAAPGPDPSAPGGFKPRAAHLAKIREMTESGLVDIMLLSASTAERLHGEGLFANSPVTPAIRLNDTTDIWSARGGRYREEPSRHHRTARYRPVTRRCRSRPLLDHLLQPRRHRCRRTPKPIRRSARTPPRTACGTSSKCSIPPSISASAMPTWASSSTTTSCARSPASWSGTSRSSSSCNTTARAPWRNLPATIRAA